MLVPDLALSELVAALEAQYDVTVSRSPRPLASGVHSRAWLVTTEGGTWVAKLSDGASDPYAKLEQLTQLCAYLDHQGLAVPCFLPLRNGTRIGMVDIQHVTYPLQLMRYYRMRKVTPDTASHADVRRAGELAARLHTCLDRYPQRHILVDNTYKSHNEWGAIEEGLFAFIEQQSQPVALATAEQEWLANVDQRAVAFVQQRYPRAVDLSLAVLHGDLNFEHIQFLDDATPYVFDFGDMCWGPVAHELAVFLQSSFRDSTLSIEEWEVFREQTVAGYTAHRQLASNDVQALPIFIINRVVAQARYIVELAVGANEQINWPVIERTYTLAEHVMDVTGASAYQH